ncbi:MAG: DUF4040 domain-containing protein [Alphaproteobacteria bacterium]|nr:DUF4040 domain-containing protein [Alphaproteobacteria bacterium]
MIDFYINITLLSFLVLTAIAITRVRNLFSVVMLSGMYSLLTAAMFVMLDAVDVAFTEAAVGAGISTVLMLATMALVGEKEAAPKKRFSLLPITIVLITGLVVVYGTSDMPNFGDPAAAIHNHVADVYIAESGVKTGLPNIVTSVLASYRGYDTLGETTVIFTAAVAVMVLLGSLIHPKKREDEE